MMIPLRYTHYTYPLSDTPITNILKVKPMAMVSLKDFSTEHGYDQLSVQNLTKREQHRSYLPCSIGVGITHPITIGCFTDDPRHELNIENKAISVEFIPLNIINQRPIGVVGIRLYLYDT
jgi:hypothetical protein